MNPNRKQRRARQSAIEKLTGKPGSTPPSTSMEELQALHQKVLEEKKQQGRAILEKCQAELAAIGLELVASLMITGRGDVKQDIGLGLIKAKV